MMYQMKTKNGYDFFEVSSAFQKSIRRGLEEEAIYWGLEFFESGFHKYAWKRMMVMAAEDVGLANPNLIVQIKSLVDTDEWIQKQDKEKAPSILHFFLAVLLCVRSPKSRIVDNALIYYAKQRERGMRLEIPDYCLDKHTRRGKMRGKSWNDFYHNASKLNNMADIDGEKFYFDRVCQIMDVQTTSELPFTD